MKSSNGKLENRRGKESTVVCKSMYTLIFATCFFHTLLRVGDAVLKMVQTDSLLFSKEFSRWIALLHEGSLSSLRSEM